MKMPNPSPSVFFFVALSTEAKPFIQGFKLKKYLDSTPFEVYLNEDIVLTISGLGKVAMAGAVAFALTRFSSPLPILLNVGIAGHADLPLGVVRVVDKVVDAETGKTFYPQLVALSNKESASLTTWPNPQQHYHGLHLCDMEASGFYEMAVKFSSSELIHCVKVISDNQLQSIETINTQQVLAWLEASVPVVEQMLERLYELRQIGLEEPILAYPQWVDDMHFTVTQRNQFKSLLGRWGLLGLGADDWPKQSVKSAKLLIAWLEQELDAHAFSL